MLQIPISKLPNIGSSYQNKLKRLNISTVEDLLYHFPSRYEDLTMQKDFSTLSPGEKVSTEGTVWQIKNIRTRYGKTLTFATMSDADTSLDCIWFNQPYISQIIKPGQRLGLSGKADYFNNKLMLVNPEYEFIRPGVSLIHTRGLIPVYPETSGVSSKWLRSRVMVLLKDQNIQSFEFLPSEVIKKYDLEPWYQAIKNIHFPENSHLADRAKKRFAFEEFFFVQLQAQKRKLAWGKSLKTQPLNIDQEKVVEFVGNLPFHLTPAQNKSVKEILADMQKDKPMNRLLQGDVGSGKTVVATVASFITYLNGKSTLLMAPTEILATQHFQTLEALLKPYGIIVGLQTGSKKTKEKASIWVGTHALIHSKNLPKNIGLIIIDEQHRFGVEQRSVLREKGLVAHFLTMSATPIPRTMALTLYGDLDISVIYELPAGRKKIKTYVVPPEKRDKAYNFIREHINKGNQAFIICPIIDPSETLETVKSATQEWERLRKEVFPEYSVELLHGRLKSKDKDKIIHKFKSGDSNILVSTPVVEVGIDVPNATIMMVEGSDRFGLAQLHQIRGRVGRGSEQSYCLLFTESQNAEILNRLKNMEKKHIGLELAELDLEIRGPGQVYGVAQHGLPIFKIASLSDHSLIEKTRKEATELLLKDPDLKSNKYLRNKLTEQNVSPD